MRSWARPLVVAVIAAASVMAVASCSSHPSSAGTPTSAVPTLQAPSLDARGLAEQQALEAYRGMWKAYVAATRTADPDSADLRRYTSADALTALATGLQSIKSRGLLGKGDVVLAPRAVSALPAGNPTEVKISDCVDSSATSLYKASGEPYTDTPGGRRAMDATVQDVGGATWKVTGFALRAVGTC